jgi:FKBP-type peptidyl-prolyl cis-trans isomerase SlyD
MPMFYKFDYAIKNENGEEVDSSKGAEPLSFTVGDGSMIPGLEQALLGHEVGDKFTVHIEPDEAYGHHQRQLVKTISKDMIQTEAEEIIKGMVFQVGSGDESQVVKVIEVEDDGIVVDGNHPLAGLTFNFDISVLEVREFA